MVSRKIISIIGWLQGGSMDGIQEDHCYHRMVSRRIIKLFLGG